MNILITGAAGFIGSHLAEYYLRQKQRVVGVDNQSGFYPPKVYQHNVFTLHKYASFSLKNVDIRSRSAICQLIRTVKPDLIIHTAALTGVREGADKPYEYVVNNVLGTQSILEACRKHPRARLVLLSSSSVYGAQAKLPFRENAVLKPKSIYAISKQATESIAQYYSHQYKLDILVVRPFSVYGPRGRMNMLPFLLLRSAATNSPFPQFGNNKQNRRDWTYIDDFVSALDKLVSLRKKGCGVFNIGSGKPVGIEDFVNTFRVQIRSTIKKDIRVIKKPKPSYEMDTTSADTSKLVSEIGPISFTPLRGGLQKSLTYYRNHWVVYFPQPQNTKNEERDI